eukprot:TRINITY_DN3713_c1_g1_i1.p1 TRINITY_DN3713_c1_g1~~TRINITY_DN3713_c1_g1_i1.p1  ORF type:complete len:123 (-),score=17.43 TRINITY_DN3713_c1_g1_i1:182-550(-)
MVRTKAMVTKLPGFFFSSYESTATWSPIIITLDHYQKVLDMAYNSAGRISPTTVSTIPKEKLFVKFRPNATSNQIEDVVNGLRNFFDNNDVMIFNAAEMVAQLGDAIVMLNFFSQIIGVLLE